MCVYRKQAHRYPGTTEVQIWPLKQCMDTGNRDRWWLMHLSFCHQLLSATKWPSCKHMFKIFHSWSDKSKLYINFFGHILPSKTFEWKLMPKMNMYRNSVVTKLVRVLCLTGSAYVNIEVGWKKPEAIHVYRSWPFYDTVYISTTYVYLHTTVFDVINAQ